MRLTEIERTQAEQHRDNREALARINGALFDEQGRSRLSKILDVMTAIQLNGKVIAWLAVIATGFGTAVLWVWNRLFSGWNGGP